MSLSRYAEPMRLLAMRLGVLELHQLMQQQPTVHEALRVSVHYYDWRSPDSIATLTRGHGDSCQLQLIYDKTPKAAQLDLTVPLLRYQQVLAALRRARFDSLDDEADMPHTSVDLWLIERIAGSFYHDVVLCPAHAGGHHREIVLALREKLPEAVREGA